MTHRLLYIALSALLLWSCSDDTSEFDEPDASCVEDLDCPPGAHCQLGLCVVGPDRAPVELAFYVEPGPGVAPGDGPNWFSAETYMTGSAVETFATRRLAVLQGDVLLDDATSRSGLAATLYFTASDGLPGRRFRRSVQTDGDGAFSVALPDGAYSLTVRPERSDIPERTFEIASIQEAVRAEFVLPAIESYIRWQGRVARLDSNNVTRPVARATVFAASIEGGAQSTVALTDDDGRFAVFVDPDAGPFRFQIRSSQESESDTITLPIPSATFAPLQPEPEYVDGIGIATIPGGDLVVGQFFSTRTLSGRVVDADGDGVPRVNVIASARVSSEGLPQLGPELERLGFESRTQTLEDGSFSFSLVPGLDYRLVATQFEEQVRLAPAQSVTSDELLPDEPEEVTLTLENAVPQRLHVSGPDGTSPSTIALVEAELLDFVETPIGDYQLPDDLTRRSAEVPPGDDATLPLFPGRWQFTLEDESWGPHPRSRSFESIARAQQSVNLRYAQGGIIAGNVTDHRGNPLPQARVEVWTFDEAGPFLIETVISESDGSFRCRVPLNAELTSEQ